MSTEKAKIPHTVISWFFLLYFVILFGERLQSLIRSAASGVFFCDAFEGTAGVIVSLSLLIAAGARSREVRTVGICAGVSLAMMLVGAVGQGVVPLQFFGVVERFSVFAAVGFDAVLGACLFEGFGALTSSDVSQDT